MAAATPLLLRAAAPPGFARDDARSYGDPGSESAVIHGENLDVLRRLLAAGFAGRFRCAYFDPPFNSGRRFAEYEDALSPAAWLAMMRERLVCARELLSDDGALFVEIDDTEVGPLQVALDELFGREQRVSTITVVRSAATGHKAINRGPVNVTDFLLVYAKDRARFRPHRLVRARDGYDRAYSTWLDDPSAPCSRWRFRPLRERLQGAEGSSSHVEYARSYPSRARTRRCGRKRARSFA